MKKKETKYDFDDILIEPTVATDITSRYKEVTLPHMLPLFTAPMDTVVDLTNYEEFIKNGINPVLPRTINKEILYDENNLDVFVSYGFNDIEKELDSNLENIPTNFKILIDVANGHMTKIVYYCKIIKLLRPDIIIMVGNIANPETYRWYSKHNCVDYIRVGIGNGCFIGETLVKTNIGNVKISNIETGDLVYTHKNELKEVLGTKIIDYDGNMVKINDNIVSTPDHKFCVVNKKYANEINENNIEKYCEWISASELFNNSEYLLIEM